MKTVIEPIKRITTLSIRRSRVPSAALAMQSPALHLRKATHLHTRTRTRQSAVFEFYGKSMRNSVILQYLAFRMLESMVIGVNLCWTGLSRASIVFRPRLPC